MKRIIFSAAIISALLFTSCEKKGNTYEFAQITYPGSVGAIVYADQPSDSLVFATTYNWQINCPYSWIHMNPDSLSGNVKEGYFAVVKNEVRFDVNNTGKSRGGILSINMAGAGAVSTYYMQVPFHNMQRPGLVVKSDTMYIAELVDSAAQVRDSIVFRTYDKWELAFKNQSDTAWIKFQDNDTITGNAGTHCVYVETEKNVGEDDRSAVLQLSCKGVITEFSVLQKGKKEE